MTKEIVPGFWKRALETKDDVTVAGIGAGLAFFVDAKVDWLPHVEPLVALAPGAAAAVGVLGLMKLVYRYAYMKSRALFVRSFARELREAGRVKLEGDLQRLAIAYRYKQISLPEFNKRLDVIVEKWLKSR